MKIAFENIPTYNYETKKWSHISFSSQEDLSDYLDSLFKEPGQYAFDESTKDWNAKAKNFDELGYYTDAPYLSSDYKAFWDEEKEKCRKGVIWVNGNNQWYTERAYYMFLNFLPIVNKERGNIETFADIRDVQYHISLYEKRAEAHNKHALITKKRQCASSYYHTAKMINAYWFERKAMLRNLASDLGYLVGEEGIWNYYNGYRDFLNENTAWWRPNSPNQDMKWIQRIEVNNDGRKSFKGRKSVMMGISLKKSATKGVGGLSYYNYHEEAGIAPRLDTTYIYMKPSLESGIFTTGLFIAAGSVGDLKDCKPLKKFMYSPVENGFLGTTNHFVDKDGIPKITGLYIPEQWGMPPFFDEFGNSNVDAALSYLNTQYEKLEQELDPSDYQLTISQHPRFLNEAFDTREVSKFPKSQLNRRKDYIKLNHIKGKNVELFENRETGKIEYKFTSSPEMEYPVDPKQKDKRGVVTIYHPPGNNPQFLKFFGGVDNVEVGYTNTSESLFSIYIVEGITEKRYLDKDGKEKVKIVGNRIAASYTGRYDDLDDTNHQGEMLIRLYNAFTLCEKNKPNFITHMLKRGYRHLLARTKDIPIFQEASNIISLDSNTDIGIHMGPTGEKQRIADDFLIQWLKQERDAVYEMDEEGNLTEKKSRIITNVDEIDDYWLIEELLREFDNTDRRDALRLAILLKTVQEAANRKTIEYDEESYKKIKKVEYREVPYNFLGGYEVKKETKQKSINLLQL